MSANTAAEVAQYDAEIKYAQARLDYATIRSPINGRISIRNVDPGNLIRAGQIHYARHRRPAQADLGPHYGLAAKELEQHGVSLGVTKLPVIRLCRERRHAARPRRSSDRQRHRSIQTTGTITLKANFPNEQ